MHHDTEYVTGRRGAKKEVGGEQENMNPPGRDVLNAGDYVRKERTPRPRPRVITAGGRARTREQAVHDGIDGGNGRREENREDAAEYTDHPPTERRARNGRTIYNHSCWRCR